MRACFGILAVVMLAGAELHAIPNSFFGNANTPVPIIPAFPRFNADLTEEFLTKENWADHDFSGPWEAEPSLPELTIQKMSALPVVMGEVPMSVVAYSDDQGVAEIAIHYLDAGLYFGYRYGGEQTREDRDAGREKRNEFARYYKDLSKSLTKRLEDGCGRGQEGMLGHSPMLRTGYVDYQWEDFILRLIEREDHSVSLHIFRKDRVMKNFVDRELLDMSRRERESWLPEKLVVEDFGVPEIVVLAMFTQGATPFCSVHSLAMVSHYLGMKARPETLVAAADFKNTGSAGGSDLVEVHRAVAQELGMRVSISPKFDASKAAKSIEDGLPMIVWRKVSAQREQAHQVNAARLKGDPTARLAPLSREDREKLPPRDTRGTPSHASIVTGVDLENGEVIYTEPWGDSTRGRRMRVEEMEATVYAVFYFKL